jgi:hypothetical protein
MLVEGYSCYLFGGMMIGTLLSVMRHRGVLQCWVHLDVEYLAQ